jgi:uncharacterized small protein (DUF1192 family)
VRINDDDPFMPSHTPSPRRHEIGQNLDHLSVHELDERIELLLTEIERLKQTRQSKQASQQAAHSFFTTPKAQ